MPEIAIREARGLVPFVVGVMRDSTREGIRYDQAQKWRSLNLRLDASSELNNVGRRLK